MFKIYNNRLLGDLIMYKYIFLMLLSSSFVGMSCSESFQDFVETCIEQNRCMHEAQWPIEDYLHADFNKAIQFVLDKDYKSGLNLLNECCANYNLYLNRFRTICQLNPFESGVRFEIIMHRMHFIEKIIPFIENKINGNWNGFSVVELVRINIYSKDSSVVNYRNMLTLLYNLL